MKASFYLSALLLIVIFGCTDSAKDEATIRNSIAAEAQLQKMNLVLYYTGERYASQIKADYSTTPKHEESKALRRFLFRILDRMKEIDSLTANIIHSIDQVKVSILKNAGKHYSIKSQYPALPNDFDFSKLTNILDAKTDPELLRNTEESNLFDQFKAYRNELVKIISRTEFQETVVIDINDFNDETDLKQKVDAQISSKVPNPMEDRQAVTDVYTLLSLPDHLMRNGKKTPWEQAVFQHSNLIGALTQLTILQNKILGARSYALSHISSRYNSCGYGFDRILPFAKGPSIIHEGETAEITVGISAFDSYNQPEVVLQSTEGEVLESEKGVGKVRVKPKEGLQKIQGLVSIRNGSGIKKTEHWEWDIQVLPKK